MCRTETKSEPELKNWEETLIKIHMLKNVATKNLISDADLKWHQLCYNFQMDIIRPSKINQYEYSYCK